MALSPGDPNSFSRPDLVAVTHTHLKLNVNFEKNELKGYAILDLDKKNETAEFLYLDVRGLILTSITDVKTGKQLNYTVGETVSFGSKLSVELPSETDEGKKTKYKIQIEYRTNPNATALQWLKPQQTAGGKHPYLFSQCEAIHARSMLPCQDTPSVKSTYSAEITAPSELIVLMSALRGKVQNFENGTKLSEFNQPVPIPSYLIAIVVGSLVSKQIGKRSHVWTEQEFIDAGAYEFADTEKMLQTAEDLCGPYVWGVYDLLILPPSFPFGGMENPCLTFVTPTLLAGDRSLADVVAHEITHSWTGNLITNVNFEHFWLNEGFTRFIQDKITGRMHGEKARQFSSQAGLLDLQETVKVLGEKSPLTHLVPDLKGIDPDDAFSSVPYEKGNTFLFYLETLLGGAEKFEPFLKSYLNEFKYKSVSTDEWKKYLYDYFQDQKSVLDSVEWEKWLHEPGMPPVIPDFDDSLRKSCIQLAERWIEWDGDGNCPFEASDVENLLPQQTVVFLTELQNASLPMKKLTRMSETYHFDSTKNAEIKVSWLRLCLKGHWSEKVSDALEFVNSVGRMKYIRPIYRDMYDWEEMRQRAIDNYMENKDKMMYVTAKGVATDLHL